MKTPEVISLPVATEKYTQWDEQVMRRTVEQAIQTLREDVISVRDTVDGASSIASRKREFLLMGG